MGADLHPRRSLTLEEAQDLYQPRARSPQRAISRWLARDAIDGKSVKAIVVGSRGSGKSTELARLAWEVRAEFLAVRVDLAGAFDERSTTLDLLVLLAAAATHAAQEWGVPLQDAARERLLGALATVGVAAEDFGALVGALEPASAVAGAPGAAAAGGALFRVVGSLARSVLARLDRESATSGPRLVDALNGAILDLRAHAANDKPVLFLTEGLDRLTDLSTIRSVFRDVDLVHAVDAPMVLTAPIAARHTPWAANAAALRKFDLWNAAVVHRDATPGPEVDEIVGMYRRRAEALGAAELVEAAVLQAAARWSSGNAREFFLLLESAMDRADELGEERVREPHLVHGVDRRRHQLQVALRTGQLELLRTVLAGTGTLPETSEADELLYENFVACYPNEDAWYRPNEILVPWLDRLEVAGRGA